MPLFDPYDGQSTKPTLYCRDWHSPDILWAKHDEEALVDLGLGPSPWGQSKPLVKGSINGQRAYSLVRLARSKQTRKDLAIKEFGIEYHKMEEMIMLSYQLSGNLDMPHGYWPIISEVDRPIWSWAKTHIPEKYGLNPDQTAALVAEVRLLLKEIHDLEMGMTKIKDWMTRKQIEINEHKKAEMEVPSIAKQLMASAQASQMPSPEDEQAFAWRQQQAQLAGQAPGGSMHPVPPHPGYPPHPFHGYHPGPPPGEMYGNPYTWPMPYFGPPGPR